MKEIKNLYRLFSGMIIISILISGCGFYETEKSKDLSDSIKEQIPVDSELFKDVKIIKFMAGMPGSASMRAAEIFAKNIEEKTKGEIHIEIFKTGELGSQKDVMEGVSKGTVEMAILPPGRLQSLDARFSIFGYLGCFLENIEQADKYTQTKEYQEMYDSLNKNSGIKVMGIYSSGQRHIWTSKKQITVLQDLKNLKIRVSEQNASLDVSMSLQLLFYKSFGVEPVIMSLADVTAGIRSGLIDGMDGNAADIITNKLTQVIKYCVLTNHTITIMAPILSEKTWQVLNSDHQKILTQEMVNYERNVRQIMKKEETDYLSILKEEGIIFTTITEQERMEYKAILNSAVEKQVKTAGININIPNSIIH